MCAKTAAAHFRDDWWCVSIDWRRVKLGEYSPPDCRAVISKRIIVLRAAELAQIGPATRRVIEGGILLVHENVPCRGLPEFFL